MIIPAIDVSDGRCVRLYQGDFARATVYSDDPIAVAQSWLNVGATLIHIVDLDGARDGSPRNFSLIARLVRESGVQAQVGGGIRTLDTIATLIDLGVRRVVLGTSAVEDPQLVDHAIRRWPASVAVAIDARVGRVALRGWRTQTDMKAIDLAREVAKRGVDQIIYTDIERDGTLSQPNFAEVAALVSGVAASVIASGGVGSIEQIRRLHGIGVSGVIIGRAIYTGDVVLKEAIEMATQLGPTVRSC